MGFRATFCRRVLRASCSFASSMPRRRRFHLASHLVLLYCDADACALISSLLNTGDANSDCIRVLSFGRRCRRRRRLIRKQRLGTRFWSSRYEARGPRTSSSLRPLALAHERYLHASRRSSYPLICPPGVEMVFNTFVHDDMNASNSWSYSPPPRVPPVIYRWESKAASTAEKKRNRHIAQRRLSIWSWASVIARRFWLAPGL